MRLLLIAALLPLTACESKWEKDGQVASATGAGTTRSYAATGFTGVSLLGSDDVDVKIGTAFSVTATGDPKELDKLEIQVSGTDLRIGRKGKDGKWFDGDDNDGVRIHVVMPRIVSAAVAGSGDLSVEKAEGDFSGSIAGSGDLAIAALTGGKAELSVAGSGDLSAAGTATSLSASLAGSGNIDAKNLVASSADVSIAGSGDVAATVKGNASVSIIGSGDAELTGGAKCSVSKIGSGEARCS